MTNLLAALLSFAMLLTGVSAFDPGNSPVGRTWWIGNVTVEKNGEKVSLDPYATLAVTTDGAQAVYDFFLGFNDAEYFPLQAVVDADRLLLQEARDGQVLRLTAEDLSGMLGEAPVDTPDMTEMLKGYTELLSFARDYDARSAMTRRAWEIYGEMVARGEGAPDRVEYDGELIDVTTYHYTLDGAQLGALADTIYASEPQLQDFVTAYFNSLRSMPQEIGIAPAENFEGLVGQFDLTCDVTESLSQEGVDIMDVVLTVKNPQTQEPVTFNLHQTHFEERDFQSLSFDQTVSDMALSYYMELTRDGRDLHVTLNLVGNPAQSQEGDEGEGDDADELYVTCDYDSAWDEDTGLADIRLSATADYDPADMSLNLDLAGQPDANGLGLWHFEGDLSLGADSYLAALDIVATDGTVEARISDDGALSLQDYDPMALLTTLSGEAQQLMSEEAIQTLVSLFAPAPAEEAEPAQTEVPQVTSNLSYANPVFDWLPEGYRVESIDVNEQYESVTCTLSNEATDEVMIVDISPSANGDEIKYYTVGEDTFKELTGTLVTEEPMGDYNMYTADDGKLVITVYPDSLATPATDVLNVLIGLHF